MTEYTLHGNKELKVLTEWFREKLVQSGCHVEEIPGEWRSWRGECLMIFMASPTWTWTRCWSNPTEMRCKTFFILFRFFLFCQLRKSLQCPKENKIRCPDILTPFRPDPRFNRRPRASVVWSSSAVERWLKTRAKRKLFAKKRSIKSTCNHLESFRQTKYVLF